MKTLEMSPLPPFLLWYTLQFITFSLQPSPTPLHISCYLIWWPCPLDCVMVLILCVNLTTLWCVGIWSNTSLDVAVRVFFRCD